MSRLFLALDTATEAVGIGVARVSAHEVEVLVSSAEVAPRRANTVLLDRAVAALADAGATATDVGGVVIGRGPGSFTGVRIGVATAKGLAHGLGVPLYGVGTLDAIAWQLAQHEGTIAVLGDAMRGEVYPALFRARDGVVERLTPDTVAKPADVAQAWARELEGPVLVAGNGLIKYGELFRSSLGEGVTFAEEPAWHPAGAGLFAAFDAARRCAEEGSGNAGELLPVYTRLSDAEEAERAREGLPPAAPSESGVRGADSVVLRPLRRDDIDAVCVIERAVFTDAWSPGMFRDEFEHANRSWIAAVDGDEVVGYGGIAVYDDEAHVMNLAVSRDHRGRGIGRRLFERLERLAADMGAEMITLECRPANVEAIALYESRGLSVVGTRPGYYAESGEDALIMAGPVRRSVTPRTGHRRRAEGAEDTIILAIETSCDESAASVIRGGSEVLSNVVASQIDFHSRFGGVVPEIASRKHTEAIVGVVAEAMERAGDAMGLERPLDFGELDAIAVTYGPGLVGALVVGVAYAKGLSLATELPLVGVNHLEGHIFANVLADPQVVPPLVALVVSGGHTSLVHMPEWGVYRTMGETLDDAAGEAFDKVAKVLGLGYPGGPILSRMAADGDPTAIDFPRAMLRSGDYKFSLSGLKTAVINHIRHEQQAGREIDIPDLAASFQAAVVDVQVAKAVRAVEETGAVAFCLAGGVAANPALRDGLRAAIEPLGVHVSVPPFHLCTDNAAMIASAAHYRFLRGERLALDSDANPGLRLDTE